MQHGVAQAVGSLSNNDGNGNENVTWKYIFISFVLLRNYFNSLNFYKNGELSRKLKLALFRLINQQQGG